ncbi:hypothetical protein [Rickettsia felis]|nr:hypothetical protein [Rickettsia felis]
MLNSLCHSRKALPAWTPNRHCERLKVLLHGSKNTLGVIPTKAGIHHKAR